MIQVTYLGYQERVNAEPFLLVNECDSHTTVRFDKEKHILIDKIDMEAKYFKTFDDDIFIIEIPNLKERK